MAVATQVVDIDVNPLDERRRRRRAWLRIGIPVGSVALMIAAILAIALYADRANRAGILSMSDDLLATLESRVTIQVTTYLAPAARALRIVGEMVEVAGDDLTPLVQAYGIGVLREIPQIAIVSLADADGNYLMIRRGPEGGIEIKTIRTLPGPRRVTLIRRNAAGEEIGRTDDPTDSFDPRTRGWYTGAVKVGAGVFWTDPYIFFSDRRPGITVSTRHRATNGREYVLGLDLALDSLSQFLASLEIGRNGRAIIVDNDGLLIATANPDALVREVDGKPVNQHIDQLDDPVLVRAYDAFRVEGPGRRVIELDDRRHIALATPLPGAASDWLLLMVVPEADFTGFVTANSRNALAMSLVIVLIAALLGVLLVRQGLRADRGARLLLDRQRTIQRQSAAFASLAADAELFDPTRDAPPRALTETLAGVADARRASVWRLTAGGRTLRCEDSFDRDSAGHVAGMELHRDELPQFFVQLETGATIDVADAAADRRTAELHRVVMNPLGSRALLAVPVRRGEQVVGAIWLEDAPRRDATADFVTAVANMVALRMAEAPSAAATRTAAPALAATTAQTARSFEAELHRRGFDAAGLHAEVYPDVAAMVLLFTDPEALAARSADAERSLSDEIARALQDVAARYDIPYLKIVGQEVVAAVGFGGGAADAASVVADAAVAMRDRCIALYEDMDRLQDVRIGIDCGIAIGCAVGHEPRVFNLWGEAVRAAHAMAASALPGTVQITQAAYERLRHDFLFRPRGRFYMPHIGEVQTFVLAGRL